MHVYFEAFNFVELPNIGRYFGFLLAVYVARLKARTVESLELLLPKRKKVQEWQQQKQTAEIQQTASNVDNLILASRTGYYCILICIR